MPAHGSFYTLFEHDCLLTKLRLEKGKSPGSHALRAIVKQRLKNPRTDQDECAVREHAGTAVLREPRCSQTQWGILCGLRQVSSVFILTKWGEKREVERGEGGGWATPRRSTPRRSMPRRSMPCILPSSHPEILSLLSTRSRKSAARRRRWAGRRGCGRRWTGGAARRARCPGRRSWSRRSRSCPGRRRRGP